MMGLKKHGTTRKKVLNLSDSASSSKGSWQNKYQHIAASGPQNLSHIPDAPSNLDESAQSNNPLSGLLQCYESDCSMEDENDVQIDCKVDNFMKEIQDLSSNENKFSASTSNTPPISSPENLPGESNVNQYGALDPPSICVWQECFDENLKHPYYWNTVTNVVSWEVPAEYSLHVMRMSDQVSEVTSVEPTLLKNSSSALNANEPSHISLPLQPGIDASVEKSVEAQLISNAYPMPSTKSKTEKVAELGCSTLDGVPYSEQISLNSAPLEYYVEEGTPADEPRPLSISPIQSPPIMNPSSQTSSSLSLAAITSYVKKETCVKTNFKSDTKSLSNQLALVANYGPDSDEEMDVNNSSDTEIMEDDKPVKKMKTVCSTSIFPIFVEGSDVTEETLDPDILILKRKFIEDENEKNALLKLSKTIGQPAENQDSSDSIGNSRAFQRKKRIDVDIIPTAQSAINTQPAFTSASSLSCDEPGEGLNTPRTGFGFSKQNEQAEIGTCSQNKKSYSGIQFIKAETINITESKSNSKPDKFKGNDSEKDWMIEDEAKVIIDKLSFLLEAETATMSPVMALHFQLETLLAAWQAGALSCTYLMEKLKETSSELSNQEMSVAPAGWVCFWDRYENVLSSNICQTQTHITCFHPPCVMEKNFFNIFLLKQLIIQKSMVSLI